MQLSQIKSYASKNKAEIAAALILLVVFAQLLFLIDYQSGVLDEQFYPGVGKYFVTNGDFSPFAFRYHPILPYYINSLFLYFDGNPVWEHTPYSLSYIVENGYDWNNLLLLTRLPIALVALLLGFFIFRWAKELYGKKAALFALLLYGFEPSILAHSSFATTDLVAVAFIFIAMYYFWKLEKAPAIRSAAIGGFTLALALLSKNTALVLVPIVLFFFIWKYRKSVIALNNLKLIVLYFAIAFLVIWGAYGFQVSSVIDTVHSPEKALAFIDQKYSGFQKDMIVAGFNAPIPATAYVTTIGYNVWHSASGQGNFFLGKEGMHSEWYYFPVAFLVKSPIPLLIFLGLAIAGLAFRKRSLRLKDEKMLLAPIIVYSLFLMLALTLYIGIRHLLPIYPFLFVLASPLVYYKLSSLSKQRMYKIAVAVLLIWYVAEAAFIFPHNLSYFNEFVGPENAWKFFADTDVDWGQEVKELGRYMQRSGISTINFPEMLPYVYTKSYIDNYTFPSCTPANGLYAVTVTQLQLFIHKDCLSWLKSYEPTDKIGYSLFIYDVKDA